MSRRFGPLRVRRANVGPSRRKASAEPPDGGVILTDTTSACADVFAACCQARDRAVLIKRLTRSDKEFHFQDWVGARLDEAGLAHDTPGRNSYPDFTLVHQPEGYEVKGLGWPGREAS